MVTCKCPKCERIHEVNLIWTGHGLPRKFCPNCSKSATSSTAGAIRDPSEPFSEVSMLSQVGRQAEMDRAFNAATRAAT